MPINIVQISGAAASGKTLLADAASLGLRELHVKHLAANGRHTAATLTRLIQNHGYRTVTIDDCPEKLLADVANIDVDHTVTIYAVSCEPIRTPQPEPELGNLIVSLMAKRLKGLLSLGSWGRAA